MLGQVLEYLCLQMNKYKLYTDEKLWALFINNDKQAFSFLYDKYKRKMYNFFYSRLYQNTEIAKDATQTLFLKLIENKLKFNNKYTFKTWIYTIANNMSKNIYRQNANKKVIEFETHYEDNIDIDSKYFKQKFNNVLLSLKEENLEIFLLRYQSHLSIKEISLISQIPEGTVKSKIFYTIKIMAKQLKGFEHINFKKVELWKK